MAKLLQPAVQYGELSSRVGSYHYYTKHDDGGPVYCRAPLADGNSRITEEILVHPTRDLPVSCSGDRVHKVLISADERKVAFMVPRMWTELGDVWVKELAPGLGGAAKKAIDNAFNFTWAADNTTLYYTRADGALRPYQVFIHRLGSPNSGDIQIYQESNPEAFVDVGITKDKRFITISSNTLDSSEVRVIDAHHDFGKFSDRPQLPNLCVLRRREDGVEYYVNHHENKYFIVTNIGAPDFKMVTADSPEGRDWVDLIPPNPNVRIEDADIFKDHVVVYARRAGFPAIICYDVSKWPPKRHDVPLPTNFCVVRLDANLEYDSRSLRFSITTPLTLETTYEYDIVAKNLTMLRPGTLRAFDPTKFAVYQIHAVSPDGERVPVTLVHQKNFLRDGTRPFVVHCYGAYRMPLEAELRPEVLPLLRRGWGVALAHVRGGGELGRRWYDSGRAQQKNNSMVDLTAVAEHLVRHGYTSPDRLVGVAASAGGMVLASVINKRPELFRAAILRVPFVDPLTSMLDPSEPLTVSEYQEWGNPGKSMDVFDYVASYAPYDTVPSALEGDHFPAVYITGGLMDRRVAAWQTLKYAARLRDRAGATVLVRAWKTGGHFGEQGGDGGEPLEALAEELTFLDEVIRKA